jgi:hypothetical protein
MIDELVRDTLESQVGPPPGREIWPRVEQAGSIARRRRTVRLASVAAVSVVAVVATAVTWGALRSDGSGRRITVTTSPASVGLPSIAAGTIRLPSVAAWKPPTGLAQATLPLTSARWADDGRALVAYSSGSGCGGPEAYRVQSSSTAVSIQLLGVDPGDMSCPYVGPRSYLLRLPVLLGTRSLVDATTGRQIAVLDPAHLLVPHELPAGWSAQIEALTEQGTWARNYGLGTSDSSATTITTTQGTDVDDVLYSPLGGGGVVQLPQSTYLGHLELAKLPFAYGPNSARDGQSIPASDKLSVDMHGHDGVLLMSLDREVVVWRDGPTWYSVASSRDRRTTTGGPTGLSTAELLRIARSMAPAG